MTRKGIDWRGSGIHVPWAGLFRRVRQGDEEAFLVLQDALQQYFGTELKTAINEAKDRVRERKEIGIFKPITVYADVRILKARFLPWQNPRSLTVTPFEVRSINLHRSFYFLPVHREVPKASVPKRLARGL